ncbi:uncharacterized protein LOC129945718 [Eupeodes corollae]|uniref:uncharacterized protein LOC129945718 n=1 Tax=Eupeodes corollae TaxID=290404 RepID=UPI00248FCD1A|nr:uncharacterized protein LOC129945718 [Eupeodes corollae]
MDTRKRLLMEACVGYFNSMNLCYKQYDKEMRQMRMRFYNRLETRIRNNLRIHQMNLMNIIEIMYLKEIEKPNKKKKKRIRTLWMKKRSADWWNAICFSSDDALWRGHIRMDEETFLYLCETFEDEFRPKPNAVRESLPTKTKVAAALYKLATNEPYSKIGKKFGIHGISVQKALYQFCEACNKILKNEYISMPVDEEVYDIMQQFEDKLALPQMLGIMEGTQINLSLKANGMRRHILQNGARNMVLQSIIDPNCLFRDIAFLQNSQDFVDYNARIKNVMLVMPQKDIHGIPVPAYLVSRRPDATQWWLMKPFSEVSTPEQELFNDFMSKSSVVAEQTYRKLKGRWKILQDPMNISVSFITTLITTCCILHNILEMKGLDYDYSLSDSLEYEEVLYCGPMDESEESCPTGDAIRDHLTSYICAQFT